MKSNITIQRHQLKGDENAIEGVPPVIERLLQNRGINSADEIAFGLNHLLPPEGMLGIDSAVSIIYRALREDLHILIIGDYDADGATSTAVAIRALKMMGCGRLSYLVPNRFEYGYGLTPEIVAVALNENPDLIITVDNGIASVDGVAAARAAGVQVIITDHHLAGRELPVADAIINPNQPGDQFSSKHLAGVGVIFYLMLALRSYLRETGWFEEKRIDIPNLARLLDLVALGTVADLVKLDHNNRILVQQGLARVRAGEACEGIKAVMQVAKRDESRLTSQDFGFALGPRLNAAGRMDDMTIGIETLLCDDTPRAMRLATELDELNQFRKETESTMREEAMAILAKMDLASKDLPVGLVLYDPEWHEGVIGIIASRVKEYCHRPVIVFTDSKDGEIKGSARSIKGFHMRDALDYVATENSGLLNKFGGHAMAAGLSLPRENLEQFKTAFNQFAMEQLSDDQLQQKVWSDGELSEQEMSLELVEQINLSLPWGQGFEPPLFDGLFEVVQFKWLADKHLKMVLCRKESRQPIDAIYFFASSDEVQPVEGYAEIVYRPDINIWNGRQKMQLIVNQIRFKVQ
ncbi:MAG: single-stranded-DNA-specific exonuclease RecJ [Gammaproteobacteria bacterium]|nr:single-stranded-DNA-specific exonuclease RecJ [Gammaproteobacteria bacterium]